jgi:hypothetical protein
MNELSQLFWGLWLAACGGFLWNLYGWEWKRTFYRDDGSPYMIRYQLLVLGKLLRVYVNHTLQPDHDSRLHTHPYRASWSLKLRGWYAEELELCSAYACACDGPTHGVGKRRVERRPGLLSCIPYAHRIIYLSRPEGVWTLMIGWRRELPWGFLNADGTLEERP